MDKLTSNTNHFEALDGLRAYSAIGILLMHYWENLLIRPDSFFYTNIVTWFTNFVYLFFILSAFSLCCGYYNKIMPRSSQYFDVKTFYNRRYSRIWPFFFILVILDTIIHPNIETVYQAFANLTLAFNLLPNPHIQVIGVGWFLGLIFVFYMIFPWFVYLLSNKYKAWLVFIISVAFHIILVQYFLTPEFCIDSQINSPRHNIIYSFPFLFSGGLIYLYKDKLLQFAKWGGVLLIIVLLLIYLQVTLSPKIFGENILFQLILFSIIVIYAINSKNIILQNRYVKFISNISMEIYLCHMVMFRVLEYIPFHNIIKNETLLYWITCILGLILSILFSYSIKYFLLPFFESKMKLKKQ